MLVGGIPTPLKNDGVKVSWDDDIPNIWKIKNVPNHQTVCHYHLSVDRSNIIKIDNFNGYTTDKLHVDIASFIDTSLDRPRIWNPQDEVRCGSTDPLWILMCS